MNQLLKAFALITILLLTFNAQANKLYNKEINSAELAITINNYKQASANYIAAFKINKYPQFNDLQNALINAIKLENTDLAFEYALKMSALGVGKLYFQQSRFKWLKEKKGWAALLANADAQKLAMERKNSVILSKLREMQYKYAAIMDASNAKANSKETLNNLAIEKDKIENRLLQLFKEFGFLSEYKIGVNVTADTMVTDPIFTQIIRCSYIKNISTHELVFIEPDTFTSLLTSAENEGLVSYNYIEHVVMNKTVENLKMPFVARSGCALSLCQYTDSNLPKDRVDAERSAMGLSSYAEYVQKLKFNIDPAKPAFIIEPNLSQLLDNKWRMDTNSTFLNSNCTEISKIPGCSHN